jgi:hypothetical protein
MIDQNIDLFKLAEEYDRAAYRVVNRDACFALRLRAAQLRSEANAALATPTVTDADAGGAR